MSGCSITKTSLPQWLVIFGIFLPRHAELFFLLIAVIRIYSDSKKIYKSDLIFPMMIVWCCSIIIIGRIGYGYSKPIQQIIVLSTFFLLYEQFFKANKNSLFSLFRRYLFAVYIVSIIGFFQLIIYFLFKINIREFFSDYMTQTISDRLIRVSSVLAEGGELGTSLIPALIYLFYYNDKFNLLGNRKWWIAGISFFTMSPFVYIFWITYLINRLAFFLKPIKSVLTILLIGGVAIGLYNVIQEKDYDSTGLSGILMRISGTYNTLSVLAEESDIREILSSSNNSSTTALMANTYVGIYSPSRLLGTGIGTHEQNHKQLISPYFSDSSSALLNAEDGYSLFNRLLSEFGIIGILLYILFLYKYYNKTNILNICFFWMIICLFIRGGSYILYGTIFVHFFYYHTSTSTIVTSNQ